MIFNNPFIFAFFIDLFDNNNGISDSTTSVLIVTSLSVSTAGSQYSPFYLSLLPSPNKYIPAFSALDLALVAHR